MKRVDVPLKVRVMDVAEARRIFDVPDGWDLEDVSLRNQGGHKLIEIRFRGKADISHESAAMAVERRDATATD